MITLFGRLMLTVTVVAMLIAAARAAAGGTVVVSPAEAIERVVAQRLGGDAAVEVTALETTVAPERALQALPEPNGKAGGPMRFVMMVGRARRGVATATVKVTASYARAARAIGRHETIGAGDIEVVTGELAPLGLKRLPGRASVVGLTARRDIAAGEPLTQAVLQVPFAVRSGEPVVLTVIVGTVQVTAKAIASSSGHEGDLVRVVPEGGRPLKGRITGPGAVEVSQ
jgi:flagella basal body P-ring formation protein FlgA